MQRHTLVENLAKQLYLHLILLVLLHSQSQGAREYCQWEKFEATCANDEVVVMQSASYGRMALGACVKQNFGYLGCGVDVRDHLDGLCSGKPKCLFTVPDDTMKNMKPCTELESYLQATYSCQKVVTASKGQCERSAHLMLTSENGHLSSWQAEQGVGTKQCPWLIQVAPGQRINITLQDFGIGIRAEQTGHSSHVCLRYAYIREESRSTTICAGHQRTKTVYVSDTNTVRVEMIPNQINDLSASFLLSYTAIGCPDPEVPVGAHVQRKGNNAAITCGDGSRWHITCHENSWKGQFDNCGMGNVTWTVWEVLSNDWSSPKGILIVSCLGVALGVLIGIVLLVLALLCMRRRRSHQNVDRPLTLPVESRTNGSVFVNDCSNVPLVGGARIKEDDYGYRWTPRQMVPLPVEPIIIHDHKKDSISYPPAYPSGSLRGIDDHIYESPN